MVSLPSGWRKNRGDVPGASQAETDPAPLTDARLGDRAVSGSISLHPEDRKALLRHYRESPVPGTRLGCHILLLLDAGHPWALIAALLWLVLLARHRNWSATIPGRQHLRRVLGLVVVVATVAASAAQERSPSGQIYRELEPFVGLSGVRFEVNGLGGGAWNVGGVTGKPSLKDPETELTGLSRSEHEQLDQSIRADAAAAFAAAGIPLLRSSGSASEVQPNLVVEVGWFRVTPDIFSVQLDLKLMEAARPLKIPTKIAWTSTWVDRVRFPASAATIASAVRQGARSQVDQFIRLYTRAHAKAG
jgi:hypothetical protein